MYSMVMAWNTNHALNKYADTILFLRLHLHTTLYVQLYVYICTLGTVQLNSNLTLECVSLASTRKASNVTREIVASARTGLAN